MKTPTATSSNTKGEGDLVKLNVSLGSLVPNLSSLLGGSTLGSLCGSSSTSGGTASTSPTSAVTGLLGTVNSLLGSLNLNILSDQHPLEQHARAAAAGFARCASAAS